MTNFSTTGWCDKCEATFPVMGSIGEGEPESICPECGFNSTQAQAEREQRASDKQKLDAARAEFLADPQNQRVLEELSKR